MNREEARRERNQTANPDPHDVPGFNRATAVDDPVPDAEYGNDRPEPAVGYPEEAGEVNHTASIRDRAEKLHDDVHESGRFNDIKFDCWVARALLRLAELEADRPLEDAPDHEHDTYAHERAATMASVASELLSAVARSDIVTDVETGRLLAGKYTTHDWLPTTSRQPTGSARKRVETDESLSLCRVWLRGAERGTTAPAGLGRDPDL